MINFWASWCAPCRQEMPLLEQLYSEYQPLGFTILGVNVEEDSSKAKALLSDIPVSFPVLFDTQSQVSQLYDVVAMPSTVLIDRNGQMRYLHKGYQPGLEDTYLEQVRELIREQAASGTTVFLTTHNMTVADELCDRVAFLVAGEITSVDAPHRLKLRHAKKVARVEAVNGKGTEIRDFPIQDPLGKHRFIEWVRDHDVQTIHTLEPSLEDVFLQMTGRGLHG